MVVVGGGVTPVNRSVCLLGSLFCAHWFTSSSLHSSLISTSLSLSLRLNKDRKSGHGGTLEFQGSQVPLFALGTDSAIMSYYESSLRLHVIQESGGARLGKCFTPHRPNCRPLKKVSLRIMLETTRTI